MSGIYKVILPTGLSIITESVYKIRIKSVLFGNCEPFNKIQLSRHIKESHTKMHTLVCHSLIQLHKQCPPSGRSPMTTASPISSPVVHFFVQASQSSGHMISLILPDGQRFKISKAQFMDRAITLKYFNAGQPFKYEGVVSTLPPAKGNQAKIWILIDPLPQAAFRSGCIMNSKNVTQLIWLYRVQTLDEISQRSSPCQVGRPRLQWKLHCAGGGLLRSLLLTSLISMIWLLSLKHLVMLLGWLSVFIRTGLRVLICTLSICFCSFGLARDP
jgi:hypothetical protein